jgi:hypothetical protein
MDDIIKTADIIMGQIVLGCKLNPVNAEFYGQNVRLLNDILQFSPNRTKKEASLKQLHNNLVWYTRY